MKIKIELSFEFDTEPEHWETDAEGKPFDQDDPIATMKAIKSHMEADFDQVLHAMQDADKTSINLKLLES